MGWACPLTPSPGRRFAVVRAPVGHPKGCHSALGVLPEGPHSYGLAPAPVAQVGILGVLQLTIVITGPSPHRRVALVMIMRTPRSLTLA